MAPEPPGGPPVLALRQATVAYEREPVVEGVDGEVAAGQSVALIGPNGAGKSTLIRAVLGLVPLTGGTIQVLGRAPQAARRQVAYVPQADTLDAEFPVSALQVVLMGRYPRIGWVRRPGRPTGRPRPTPWPRSAWPSGPRPGSAPSRAASASGSCWQGRSPRSRGCCCWTSRSTGSTPSPRTCC